MTREEAIEILQGAIKKPNTKDGYLGQAIDMAIQALSQEPTYYPPCIDCNKKMDEIRRAYDKLKEQEPCTDAISREAVLQAVSEGCFELRGVYGRCEELINALPPVNPQPCEDAISREAVKKWICKTCPDDSECQRDCDVIKGIDAMPPVTPQQKSGKCKNCKYFEYDSVARVDGIPLIVAHEICNKWGDGCKTKEYGYCFLFEPQESEDKAE